MAEKPQITSMNDMDFKLVCYLGVMQIFFYACVLSSQKGNNNDKGNYYLYSLFYIYAYFQSYFQVLTKCLDTVLYRIETLFPLHSQLE